jgi:hypothetical protein
LKDSLSKDSPEGKSAEENPSSAVFAVTKNSTRADRKLTGLMRGQVREATLNFCRETPNQRIARIFTGKALIHPSGYVFAVGPFSIEKVITGNSKTIFGRAMTLGRGNAK